MDTRLQRQQQKLAKLLNESTPLMPAATLHAFVSRFLERRDVYLQAVQRHGSPLYLQELDVLRRQARRFRSVFERHLTSASFYYAVKSNNHPNIARVAVEEGYGLDVSSGQELELALTLGVADIVFSGPGKTDAELKLAADNSDRVVVLIDSIGELHRLAVVAAELEKTVRCGVRLCMNPTGLWRKFGIPLQTLPAFWEAAETHPHIQLSGLQFHASWNLNPDVQVANIEALGRAVAGLPAAVKSRIRFVDIGGGYWPEQGEWLQPAATPEGAIRKAMGEPPGRPDSHHILAAASIETFARAIGSALENHLFPELPAPCKVFFEPGRWICNDAVALIMSVVDKKDENLVITDAGTNAVGWERFESDYFPVINLSRPSLTETGCHILGSLCTPHDLWGNHYFGSGIEPGDILLIPTQGAYTYSLRQNFIKPLPKVVAI